MLRSYIEGLNRSVEAAREAELKAQRAPLRAGKELTLVDQITELMATLPPAQRDRPWSVQELVPRLKGKYRDRPHPADLGQALRQLGWARRRDWSKRGGGRRVWMRSDD